MAPTVRIALRVARVRSGLRQYQVARRIGVTPEAMSRFEAGTLNPSARTRALLAGLFGVPELDLFPEDVALAASAGGARA